MKVTFIEELESKHAWRASMYCPQCDEGKYTIHHQFQPWPDEWWISCDNCGYELDHSPTRETTIMRWKGAHHV